MANRHAGINPRDAAADGGVNEGRRGAVENGLLGSIDCCREACDSMEIKIQQESHTV